MKIKFRKARMFEYFGYLALAGIIGLAVGIGAKLDKHQKSFSGLEAKVESVREAEANEPNRLSYVVEENAVEENVAEKTSNDNVQNVDYKRLYEMIARHEGIRHEVYSDTKGIKTIGAGFNLEKAGARERIESLGLDYNDVCSRKQKLSDEQIYSLMKNDIETAISDAKNYVGENWNELDPKAREVIIDMAYNLGGPRLNKFKKLKEALKKQDYQTAADEMKDSKWYYDVGNRSKELINIMKSIDNQEK